MSLAGGRLDLTSVSGGSAAGDSDDREALLAPTLAKSIVAVVFGGFAVVALLFVLESGKSAVEVVLAAGYLAGLLSLQLFYFGRSSTNLHAPAAYAMLAAQAGLVYLPLAQFGQSWVSQPAFLAGSVLLVLPLPLAWPAFVAIVAGAAVAQAAIDDSTLGVVYIAVNAATAGLFVYGLTRLARLVTALHEARDELAKTAVAHQRLRFTRELHNVLGLKLSAIVPKGELALRLVRQNPERATQELAEILVLARQALADVRSIARVYREVSLDQQTRNLASMLAASNVELRIELDHRQLPAHLRSTVSAVLREGVANVLRHRDVSRCEITLRQRGDSVRLDIVDDGVASALAKAGFDDLSATVSKMAGELTAGADPDGRFRLHVAIPMTAPSPPDRPRGTVAGPAGDFAESRESITSVAARLAGGLVVAVFFGLFLQAVLRLVAVTGEFGQIALGTGYLLATLGLQLGYFSRPGNRPHPPAAYLMLLLQGLLVYLPMLQFQEAWTGLPGFLAGSALLVLRPVAGWTVFAAVVATVAWAQVGFGAILPRDIGFNIALTVSNGLIVYGLTWMARSVRQLRAVRLDLAEVAVAQTRLRFARDLHDLLGLSLSAITLKCELAHRFIVPDPTRARTELTDVLAICRHALADVRSVASGHPELSLDEECRTAGSLLTAAGMDVRMDLEYGDLPADTGTVLATVLREGVTNVLRHSKGEHCEITIRRAGDEVDLHVVNDGVTEPSERDHRGSGIRNLSERVAALGGTLTAEFEGRDRFALRAQVPVAPATSDPAGRP
ncbi:MAG TPA: histidine kinase [Actinophytocola sp.]|uniref:sensor histidine kinase n=1 Tax=Actinophytocola sp. TaxID=1872138 RepID=UPI002DB97542|nr:histidine kinase [Actinophytocola sp.]HEU5470916.1 histidine kinase [Actinophytocola sp.]